LNKKAIWALLLAIMLPLVSYWIVNYYSRSAINMPRRYFFDSVIVSENNGKKETDTVWHRVTGPVFTDQFGRTFKIDQLKNKAVVINFMFTRCPTICPGLTRNMRRLQASFKGDNDSLVHFISISIDPEHDSTADLRRFADKFKANHDNWSFLRADKKATYDFAFNELKASVADPGVDTAFIHTENFFLLDDHHVLRGWYNGLDSERLSQLAFDIPLLMLEKDKDSPRIFSKFIPILPLIFLAFAIAIIATLLLSRKRK